MSSPPTHFNNSSALVLIVDSILNLNGNAMSGMFPFIITADVSTFNVSLTLRPETVKLNVPVLPDQDSSRSLIYAKSCLFPCLINH